MGAAVDQPDAGPATQQVITLPCNELADDPDREPPDRLPVDEPEEPDDSDGGIAADREYGVTAGGPGDDLADEQALSPEEEASTVATAEEPALSGSFLDDLHSAAPVAKSAGPSTAASARPASKSKASKPKVQFPLPWIIGGAVGGVVLLLLLILIAVVATSGGSGGRKGGVEKWGLSESTRKQIFYDCIEAVDNYGQGDACKRTWKTIRDRNGISADVLGKILEEGFNPKANWDQPPLKITAETKAHRVEWIKKRTEMRREPLL